jgi:hypothetical protein
MSFIHGYLLAGLVLAGLPILVHLAMRQKPKQLFFPAFRFLKRRLHVNRRRLRLQHLLLLALRIGVLAALCLALARPRVESGSVSGDSEQPVAAVFLFDTSPSMGYLVGDESRLAAARRHAEALLADMADGSRVAVLDCGDEPGSEADRPGSVTQAAARVKGLTVRPSAHPVNAHLGRAYQSLNALAAEGDTLPRLLYVFSDRTRPAWTDALKAEELPPGVRAVFVDVGVEEPHDLAIERIEVVPPVAEPGKDVQVYITVRCTGGERANQLDWQIDNDPVQDKPPVKTKFVLGGAKGKEKTFVFRDVKAPPLPAGERTAAFQITAKLDKADPLPFNDSRSATFLVRHRRSLLTIADDPAAADNWEAVFGAIEEAAAKESKPRPLNETLRCEVVPTKAVEAGASSEKRLDELLGPHDIVCLYQAKKPSQNLWAGLQRYVNGGGNLIVVPGGAEVELKEFNAEGTKAGLLPGTLVKLIDAADGVKLKEFKPTHALTKPFAQWQRSREFDFNQKDHLPEFRRYWEVTPDAQGVAVMSYADAGPHPALLEREVGRGRVLMFTTPLDNRLLEKSARPWSNIWNESSFGLVLVDLASMYMVGGAGVGDVNFFSGKPVLVPLLRRDGEKQYQLKGPPGLTLSETKVAAPEGRLLSVPQATHPGNYTVVGEGGKTVTAFSVNIPAEESQLDRVPGEEIEAALGEGSLLPPGQAPRLQDSLKDGRAGQIELLPWLLMAVLLVLAVESVLANKFYKRAPKEAESEEAPAAPRVAETAERLTAGTAARST